MKVLFSKKSMVIAAIAVLIAIITIIFSNVFGSGDPVTSFAGFVLRPFREITLTVTRTFEGIYSSIYKYDALYADYEQVVGDLAAIEEASKEVIDLRAENTMLRELLGFSERHAGLVLEEADFVSWSADNWSSTFAISKGYANSLTPMAVGNSVITSYGALIGKITDVGAASSTVQTLLDTKFSAGVYVGDRSATATAKGDFSLMTDGMLKIDNFSEDSIILPGDSVVTSNAGGVFPQGLVVGEVVEVLRHNTGLGSYATVEPMRVIDNSITDVFVITSFDIVR